MFPKMQKLRHKTEREKYPHVVKLPKNSTSPTNSIYKHFDILMQTKAVNTYSNIPTTVRCAEPFTLEVKLPSGKVKVIKSKLDVK